MCLVFESVPDTGSKMWVEMEPKTLELFPCLWCSPLSKGVKREEEETLFLLFFFNPFFFLCFLLFFLEEGPPIASISEYA